MYDAIIENIKQKMFKPFEDKLKQQEKDGTATKVETFLIRTMPNIVGGLGIFLGMLWIFNKIYLNYGIERVMIIFGIIVILTLRGIHKTLNQI